MYINFKEVSLHLVKVKVINENIYLFFDYDKQIISYIKNFEGRKWLKELGVWSIPYFDNYMDTFRNNRYAIEFVDAVEESIKNKDFQRFLQIMKIRKINNKSFKIYSRKIEEFLLDNPDYVNLDEGQIYLYINNLNENMNFKNQLINSIRIFYLYVFDKKMKIENIQQQKNISM